MNRFRICMVVVALLLGACAERAAMRLPELADGRPVDDPAWCRTIFPEGRWQLVHAIDFSSADGFSGSLIGVTVLADRQIRSALTTIEGVTLFEAVLVEGEGLEIHRSVYPFDKPAFAGGLMEDVRTIFLPPAGREIHRGRLTDGVAVCRYLAADGRVTDIAFPPEDRWQITIYGEDLTREKLVSGRLAGTGGETAALIELRSYLSGGYVLKMKLLSAEKLP